MSGRIPFDPVSNKLLVGLEIHQQIGTGLKLFCSCPTSKKQDSLSPSSFTRRLRPTQSELGYLDPAAVFEFLKGKPNVYRWSGDSSCLVEADEEPPHPLDAEALDTVIMVAEMLGSTVVDEVHVMRKIVIDGSNTSGFQRTAVVALGGRIEMAWEQGSPNSGPVGVQTVTIEEDAARLLGEDPRARQYALDRLGVPLVEIALDPVVGDPKDVEAVAYALGRILRSTRRVARGIGTIRQDLNVSLLGGLVVEVKGVQKLGLLRRVIAYEATRQMGLVTIAREMAKRGIVGKVECRACWDAREALRSSGAQVIRKALAEEGKGVVCIAVDRMHGLFGFEPFPGIRVGKELAEIARVNGLGGVIHSDEFEKQGVSEKERSSLLALTDSKADAGLVLVAGERSKLSAAVPQLIERLERTILGVPAETRAATENGETRFLRPRPGAARMYPETDIPEIVIDERRKADLARSRPEPWESQVEGYARKYGLSQELALLLYDSDSLKEYEERVQRLRLAPSFVASVMLELPVRLSREGIDGSKFAAAIPDVLDGIDEGRFAKEGAIEVLRAIGKGEARTVDEAVAKIGIALLSDDDLQKIVDSAVEKSIPLIREKGERAFGTLMGEVMREARGRVDGQKVSEVLRKRMLREVRDGKTQPGTLK